MAVQRRTVLKGGLAAFLASFSRPRSAVASERQLRGYLRTNWSQDPYAFGSYSFVPQGETNAERAALEAPIAGRVYFAGEATHPPYASTVHAAYESGQRVAGFVRQAGHRRVAIVGAGMSGLSAAHALSGSGIDVHVFEARDRIGGRIWTDTSLGVAVDLGASWIHGTHGNPLVDLAEAAGQQTMETEEDVIVRTDGGGRRPYLLAPGWLREVNEGEHAFGAELQAVNLDAYDDTDGYDGPDVKFPAGYAGIFSALEGDYALTLSKPVQSVAHTGSSVTLTFEDNDQAQFDAVIVTVPLGVLKAKALAFDPPLPARKKQAIDRLGMGTLDKLFLLFDEPFWDEEATWIYTMRDGEQRGVFNGWLNFQPYLGVPLIMAFNSASTARELGNLTDEALLNRAMAMLDSAYPK